MADNTDKEGFEKPKSDADIIKEAMAFYQEDRSFEDQTRKEQLDDRRFALGLDHWIGDSLQSRVGKKPMLVVPRINEFLNKVKNENRQNKPSIKVYPAGAISEDVQSRRVKAAKHRQGLIRHIQNDSKATQAYQTAYDDCVDTGRGYFRIITEYLKDSFNQKIVIKRIRDQFSVTFDRKRKELDYSDAKRAFVEEKVSRERFKADWPGIEPTSWINDGVDNVWMGENDLSIVEYYCIRYRTRMLYLLDDNDTIYEDEIKELDEDSQKDHRSRIQKRRKVKEPYVLWYKLTAFAVLEKGNILGEFIPIIPVIGTEAVVNGELIIKGMTRDGKDSQRMFNFWESTEAELLTLSPKSPYIAAAGQIAGQPGWATANTIAHSVLTYKEISVQGTLVPPPKREQFAGVPVGVVNAKNGVVDNMRAIFGIHTSSLGMTGPEKSGRAIIAQQREGATSTYHYVDAMGIALSHAGRIINSWLPDVYDTARIEKILGDDNEESTIELGGQDDDGEEVELGSGEFDVVVTMGPNHITKRREAVESMMEFMKAVPGVVPLIYDLMVKNMDWPGAQEIADRLRKTIPPEILEQAGGEQKMAAQLQELTQKVQQYEQAIPELTGALEKAMKELDDKGAEISKDLQINDVRAAASIRVALIKAGTEREKNFQNILQTVQNNSSKDATGV